MSEVKQPSRTNPVRHNNQCSPNDCVCVLGDHWRGEPTANSGFEVGDRVRVVIEADVLEASNFDGDGIMLEAWNYVPPVGVCGVVLIEVIAPLFLLPTKRWAQVTDNGVLWTLTGSGMWVNLHGDGRHSTKLTESSHLRVISEGVSE
jgi:hypothetical protein